MYSDPRRSKANRTLTHPRHDAFTCAADMPQIGAGSPGSVSRTGPWIRTQSCLRLVLLLAIMVAFSTRHFWLERLRAAWRGKSVVWLSGVRRSGKTTLARALPGAEYLDCELPSVRRLLEIGRASCRERV